MSFMRKTGAALAAGALALGLVACSTDDGGGDGGSGGGETIRMGYLPSWSDGLSMAHIMEHQLDQMGYEVEHVALSDAAVVYEALSSGDIDMYPSAWPEATHIEYAEEYSDSYESLGAWYEGAKLNLSVPEYMEDVNSISDLQGQADRFGGQIIGIEPGAGLTRATQEDVIPGYGLDGYTLSTSSTTAMLAELEKAIDNQDDIVVTLWTPFWANSTFPVKPLEDTEGLFPEPEDLHILAREGFSEEFSDIAEMAGQIKIGNDLYGQLENMVVNEYGEGQEAEAVQAWIEANPDVLPEVPTEGE